MPTEPAGTLPQNVVQLIHRQADDWADDGLPPVFKPRYDALKRGLECVAEAAYAAGQVQWQPIETAPKDGTYVLLDDGRDVPDVGRYFDAGRHERGFWAIHAIRVEPRRWMPLPASSPRPSGEAK